MTARRRCAAVALSFLFAAPVPSASQAPPALPVRALGELALARGQFGFAPCAGAPQALRDGTRGEAPATLRELLDGRDGVAFAEVELAPGADGVAVLVRLRRAYVDGVRCAEEPGSYVWQASGHDPAWSLLATRRTIRVQRTGERTPWFFPFEPFVRDADGVYRHRADSARGTLAIALTPGRCRDERLRLATDFSAEVTLAGTIRLRGCAWNGPPPIR